MRSIKTLFCAGLIVACALSSAFSTEHELKIGMQTWTLRNLNFEQVIEFCVKHRIKYLQLIPNHLNPNGSREEWQKKKDLLEKNGLVAYTFGVAGTSLNKEENRKLFECAKFMGMKLIVVEPNDFQILDILEELAKEYDIRVVIHNHGIRSLYGNPLVVKNLIKNRDRRIGVCMDTGWIASTRFDSAKVFKEYDGRVYDIHLKDKSIECDKDSERYHDLFLGEGAANLPELFKVLRAEKWDGVLAIETDKNLPDPTEHTVKALQFIEAQKK